jgi:hypothetical protein
VSNPSLQQQIENERQAFYARIGQIALAHGANDAAPSTPATGALAWSPTLDCGKVKHAGALKAVEKLNAEQFQGHTDWRLPEIRELLSLVDYTRHDPAIDTERFPDTKSDWYWTASSCAGDPGVAWIVGFNGGSAGWSSRNSDAFVRAVRGPSARASQ